MFEAHTQSLPAGVMGDEEEEMPPLINVEVRGEEDFEDDPE